MTKKDRGKKKPIRASAIRALGFSQTPPENKSHSYGLDFREILSGQSLGSVQSEDDVTLNKRRRLWRQRRASRCSRTYVAAACTQTDPPGAAPVWGRSLIYTSRCSRTRWQTRPCWTSTGTGWPAGGPTSCQVVVVGFHVTSLSAAGQLQAGFSPGRSSRFPYHITVSGWPAKGRLLSRS